MIETRIVGDWQGQPVTCFDLTNASGMCASIFDWGGVLARLDATMTDGSRRNLVLGFQDFADYPDKSPYFGATVGRFGNRIGGAQFKLGGEIVKVDANEAGGNHLHGGTLGFGRRLWRGEAVTSAAGPAVSLTMSSTDGDQGYPGNLTAQCVYTLRDDNRLSIEMTATCDQPTPINLVHHSYWNLDGAGKIDRHGLQLFASHYLPTGEGQIPTGEIATVDQTELDFRHHRQMSTTGTVHIDHAFVLDEKTEMKQAAVLTSSDQQCRMALWTDQPAVQCYTGYKLNIISSQGETFEPNAGICLETEAFPDAPNKPHFPNAILHPGQTYRHRMEHYFSFT